MGAFAALLLSLMLIACSKSQTDYDPIAAKDVESFWANKNISTAVVPVPDTGIALEVEVAFFINTVVSVNPADQTASIVGTLVLNWTDSQLAWNPTDFKTNRAVVPAKSIWAPTFQLITGVRPDLNVRLDTRFDQVIVNHKGMVIAKLSGTFASRCEAHTTPFPYDSQHCKYTFKSDLPTYFVQLKRPNVTEKEMMHDFKDNSEWSMQKFRVSTEDPIEPPAMENFALKTSEFHIRFTIVRQPYYYLVLLVVPILMSTILIIIIPLIPMHSGERLGFATSLYLAFVLFLLLVDNMLPKSSFSSLTISMTISVVLVLLNIFETIIVIYFDNRINNAATAASANEEAPDPPPPEPPEVVVSRPRSQSRADVMKKDLNRWMKRMSSILPHPQNPRLLMHRVDRAFAVLNFLVVVCANLYISTKLIPSYVH